MARADPLQDLVDELAAQLGLSVLIDDDQLRALRWSAQSAVDQVRLRSILDHTVDPGALAAVHDLGLPHARGVVRTPPLVEVGMQPRWCAPIRSSRALLGYLWVLDPDDAVTAAQRDEISSAARHAGRLIAAVNEPADDRRRRELLAILEQHADVDAARALIVLERQPDDIHVVADGHVADGPAAGAHASGVGGIAPSPGGWPVRRGIVVRPVAADGPPSTGGRPLPLVQLGEAVRRARLTGQALAAGAVLEAPRWDCLGSWRLVVDAPGTVAPGDVHPGVGALLNLPRPDLVRTARTLFEHGGDVRQAAEALHLHRTTLYYRLERITALTGVDLRSGAGRTDLDLALRLAAFRRQAG